MINACTRSYDYFTLGTNNAYGQPVVSADPKGQVRMAIYISSQSVQDNINYEDCQYIGITQAKVDDTYVIRYNDKKLKVLYVNSQGRFKQVFMVEM
jgi:hypothetical protein